MCQETVSGSVSGCLVCVRIEEWEPENVLEDCRGVCCQEYGRKVCQEVSQKRVSKKSI
jgi:hypothetical protein